MRIVGLLLLAVVFGVIAWHFLRFSEKRLHVEQSAFQKLAVVEADGRRCLQFGDGALNQTCVDPLAPEQLQMQYARAVMAVVLSWQPAPKRALIIGLGGGSLTMALARERPAMHSDNIELDPAVIRLAERYFGFVQSSTVRAIAGDGAAIVGESVARGEHYDLIVLDAFDDTNIPDALLTPEFLGRVKQLLGTDGSLVVNTLPRGQASTPEAAALRAVFGHLSEVDVARNRLLVAGPRTLPLVNELMEAQGDRRAALDRLGATPAWLSELRVRQ